MTGRYFEPCIPSRSMNGSSLKNEMLLRLSLPPEMGEMAQTFMSEIDWLAALKFRATGLSTSLFLTQRRCSANLSDRRQLVSPMYSLQHLLHEMQYR